MASKRTVLVCDYDSKVASDWSTRLARTLKEECPNFQARPVKPGEFARIVRGLTRRRLSARNDEAAERIDRDAEQSVEAFDSASILVIDFELLDLGSDFAPISGEEIAYFARMYSSCGLIIVLNDTAHGTDRFDLTFRGYPESFADLHVSDRLLCFRGLWSNAHLEGYRFRPWHWPNIPAALEKFEGRVTELKGKLDIPIAEYFPSIEKSQDFLPTAALAFISESKGTLASFDDFLDQSLKAKRFPKDQYRGEDARRRVAAARIHHWLERLVLPLQEILIDAPHMAMRYPSLVRSAEDSDAATAYNRTAALEIDEQSPEAEWASDAGKELLKKYRFKNWKWLTRPVWLGNEIRNNGADLPEIRDPLNAETAPVVFCEDISRFMDLKYTHEVAAVLPTANRMRYVVRKEALKGPVFRDLRKDLALPIEYEPRNRFAY